MRRAGARVETLTHDPAGRVDDHGADAGVGVTERSLGGKLEGTPHQRDVLLALRRGDLTVRHVLPLALDSLLQASSGALTVPTGHGRSLGP